MALSLMQRMIDRQTPEGFWEEGRHHGQSMRYNGLMLPVLGWFYRLTGDDACRLAGEKLAAFNNVEIVVTDFLGLSGTVASEVERVMLARLAREDGMDPGESAPIVVSNLPYSAAGPIIAALILWEVPVLRAVLTVQKEMAERLVAKPGSKDYGRLSVLVQKAAGAEILRTIPSECFWPRPAVESAVVRLGQRKIGIEHAKMIETLAGGVFQHRRKTIRNALLEATNLDMDGERADDLLRETGVGPLLRADQITPDQFGEMASFLDTPLDKCSAAGYYPNEGELER